MMYNILDIIEFLKKIDFVRVFLYGIFLILFVHLLELRHIDDVIIFFYLSIPTAIVTGCECIAIGIYEGHKKSK